MKRIITILNSPYLGNCDTVKEIKNLFLVGVFVALFLGFFQPFGFSDIRGNHWPIAALFGLVTWVFGAVYYLFTTYILKIRQDEPSWKFWKWIIYVLILLLWISIGNILLVNTLFSFYKIDFYLFMQFLVNTIAIGIFPIAVSGLVGIYRNQSLFQKEASTIQPNQSTSSLSTSELQFPDQNNKKFSINSELVYFLEAEENYVAVFYNDDENGESRKLIRNTFSTIDKYLPDHLFMRCHRSFIVNLSKISGVEGNAQGLTLKLEGTAEEIPVSRTYIQPLRERLEKA